MTRHDPQRCYKRTANRYPLPIAEQAGVTPETLSRVIHGIHKQPGFETVVRIIHAAGETVGWLLRGS
jgi:DNA-binding phage protein